MLAEYIITLIFVLIIASLLHDVFILKVFDRSLYAKNRDRLIEIEEKICRLYTKCEEFEELLIKRDIANGSTNEEIEEYMAWSGCLEKLKELRKEKNELEHWLNHASIYKDMIGRS